MLEDALLFVMKYEVGPWFKLDEDTLEGRCNTAAQKRKTGYVNDPADPGGETKFGIAKNSNPGINIKKMSWKMASAIYEQRYWKAGGCDKLPGRLAYGHFDACVNHGPKTAIKMLQRAVNITDDGDFGNLTLLAVNKRHTREDVLMLMLSERKRFYSSLVQSKPELQKFFKGWINRVDDIARSLK